MISRLAPRVLFFVGLAGWAWAGPSIWSCGGPGDLLKNVTLGVSPDPVVRGKPFTVTASGTLGAPLLGGAVDANLDAKVLLMGYQLFDDKVRKKSPFALQPGLPAGDVRLTVGPVELPADVPGTTDLAGKVILADPHGAQVACVALDFHVVLSEAESYPGVAGAQEEEEGEKEDAGKGSASSCTKPGDHMQNIKTTKKGGVVEVDGTLDEDVSQMTFDADLSVHLGFFKVPLKLSFPVSYAPGFKKGALSAKLGPPKDLAGAAGEQEASVEPKVTGQVTWKDAAKQEIACVSLSTAEGSAEEPSTVVV